MHKSAAALNGVLPAKTTRARRLYRPCPCSRLLIASVYFFALPPNSLLPTPNSRLLTHYSHSIVLGGLDEMSKQTRFTPLTSLMMRFDMVPRISYGSFTQSAVMPSWLFTARMATTFS